MSSFTLGFVARLNFHSNSIWAVIKAEVRKIVRSPLFWVSVLGMAFIPMMLGVLMFIKKYPELAQSSILLSKASMMPGNGDWPAYLALFTQMICGVGLLGFGFIASWLFGREYSDRTIKDLLALPLARSSIVMGKFFVMICWCWLLFAIATVVMLGIGLILHLSGWSWHYFLHFLSILSAATLMNIGLCMSAAFVACLAQGYLAAIGFVVVTLLMANFVGMLGFGPYYPWGIPMLYAIKGIDYAYLGAESLIIVIMTGIVGLIATLYWWRFADQN